MTMKNVVVWGVSLIVLAACGDVVVSAPTTPDCQAAVRAGETCVAGVASRAQRMRACRLARTQG